MNSLPVNADRSRYPNLPSPPQSSFYATTTKIVSTLALLILGYYAMSLLDGWPSTIKRSTYECLLRATPSSLIYTMERGLVRFGYLSPEESKFTQPNFGDVVAKQEVIRRIFGLPQLPMALQKVRSLSGPLMSLRKEPGPPGLGNWDNSCYQNSILQGFASLPAFLDYVERSEKLCDKHDIPAATHRAMVAFLRQLADSDGTTDALWTPRVLKSMDSWQQQDAQEYFSRILEAVEKETRQYARRLTPSPKAGLECLDRHDEACSNADSGEEDGVTFGSTSGTPSYQKAPATTPRDLQSPIEGMTAQCLQCKTCGFTEGLTLTQFTCLTLNLGTSGGSDIETLLDEYTEPEHIEGVECDNCTRLARIEADTREDAPTDEQRSGEGTERKTKPVLRTKVKQITIGRLPKDLVLHINRSIFDNYGNQLKNTAPVRFPPTLEFLSRWCAPLIEDDEDGIEAVYALKCVVTHYGSHHDGHYIALGKRDKDWFSFNDERVTQLSIEEVLARGNGFMLFYEAVDLVSSPAHETRTLFESGPTSSRCCLNPELIEARLSNDEHESKRSSLNGVADTMSRSSDDETFDSMSEYTESSANVTQDTTPASSESGSPVDVKTEDHERQQQTSIPVTKSLNGVSDDVKDGSAVGETSV